MNNESHIIFDCICIGLIIGFGIGCHFTIWYYGIGKQTNKKEKK